MMAGWALRAQSKLQALLSLLGGSRPGLAYNLFWLGGAAVIGRLLTFVTVAYTARQVGTRAFGLLSFGTSVAVYAAILVGPGLLMWGTRAIARDHRSAGRYLAIINLLQIALGLLAYGILFLVADHFFDSSERSIALVCGSALFAVACSVEWTAQGLEQFRLIALVQMMVGVITLVVTVLRVHSAADVLVVPVIAAGAQVFGALTLLACLWRAKLVRFDNVPWRETGGLLRQAAPLGLSGAMITILHYTNNLFLQFYSGPVALGIFAAAYRIPETLSMAPCLVASIFLPRLSRGFETDPERAKVELRWFIRIVISAACLPAALVLAEAPAVIHLVFSDRFAAAAPALRFLSLAILSNFAAVAYINGLLALHRDRAYFWSIFAAMVVAVVGGMISVPLYGVRGATVTVACLDISTWLVTLPTYRRMLHTLFLEEWVRPLLAGALAAAWLVGAQWSGVGFWLRVLVGSAAYLGLVVPWGLLRKSMPVGIIVYGQSA